MKKLTLIFAVGLTLSVPFLSNSAAKTIPFSSIEKRQWISVVKANKAADVMLFFQKN